MSDFTKINNVDFSALLNATPQYDMAQSITKQMEESQRNAMRAIEATKRERESKEHEKRESKEGIEYGYY